MHSQIIYFDIDKTLFNASRTSPFRELVEAEIVANTSISKQQIYDLYEEYYANLASTTDFNPFDFLHFVEQKTQVESKLLHSCYFNQVIYKKSLYSDVIPNLKELNKYFSLGIFSEGFYEVQMKKLELTGILQYFNKELIHIFRRKLDPQSLAKLKANSFIIDDRIDVVEELLKSTKLKPLWLNRLSTEKSLKTSTIFSLNEVLMNQELFYS